MADGIFDRLIARGRFVLRQNDTADSISAGVPDGTLRSYTDGSHVYLESMALRVGSWEKFNPADVITAEIDADIATHAALPTAHQDAPALIATHAAIVAAHHAKYTDAEAVTAVGAPALISTHASDNDAHGDHSSLHERAGTDELDGDHLGIDFTPSNYTPATTPAEAADVNDLAAHLAGIDNALVVSPIVSIQHGSVLLQNTAASGTATITAVVVANSYVFIRGKRISVLTNAIDGETRVTLTNTTTVTVDRHSGVSADQIETYFTVVEFA